MWCINMNTVIVEDINAFPPFVTIPASILQSLQDRVEALEDRVVHLEEENAALQATQDIQADNQLIQLRLINDLREGDKRAPGKTETTRAEKIERYLASRPDHKASFETLKGHLGIGKDLLNDAIKTLMESSPGRYGIIRTPGDKRKRTLVMIPK